MGFLRDSEDGFFNPISQIPEFQNPDFSSTLFLHPTGEKCGDSRDELKWVESGLNLDDTVPVDGFETQVLDFGGETQLLDDSQYAEDMGMTQLLDGFDDHVSIGSDGEKMDGTQLLTGDDDEVSDGDTSGRSKEEEFLGGDKSEVGEKRLVESPSALLNGGMSEHVDDKDGSADGHRGSGAGVRFASVRAASFRASGLAARNVAFKGTNSEHSCIQLKSHSSETAEKIHNPTLTSQDENGIACSAGRCDDETKRLKAGSNDKIGLSAARKLFTESLLFDETEIVDDDSEIAAGLTEVQLPCDYGLAGLSYVNSQEPGDLSQANALACVQKLIDENKELPDDELELGKSGRGMSSGVSIIKGPQSLARKVNLRGTDAKGGIFDWDDRREDEEGGDFFSRRKDEFFGSGKCGQKSSTRAQKCKGYQSERCINSQGTCHIKSATLFQTDSKILLNNSGVEGNKPHGCKLNVVRDLGDEFDEVSDVEPSGEQFENLTGKVVEEMFDVGFDTQMAAEAMEALMNGKGNVNGDANNDHDSREESSERQIGRIAHQKKCFQESISRVGVSTRKSRKSEMVNAQLCKSSSPASEKHADNLKMQHGPDKVTTKCRKAKCKAEKVVTSSGRKVVNQMPSDIVEPRKEARVTESNLLGELDICQEAAPGGHCSAKRWHLPQDGASFIPIAHRTRRSLVQLNDAGNPPRNSGEENNNEMMDDALELNTASPPGGGSAKALIGKKRKSSRTKQSGEVENSTLESTAKGNDHEGDALELNTGVSLSGSGASKAPIGKKRKSSRIKQSVEVENSTLKSIAKHSDHEMGGDAVELNTASPSGSGASKALIGKKRKSSRAKPSVKVENSTLKSTANGNDHEMGGDAPELNTASLSRSGASKALIGKKRKSSRAKPSVEVENLTLKSTAKCNDHEMGVDALEPNTTSLSVSGASKVLIGKKRKSSRAKPSVEVENSMLKSTANCNDHEMGVDALELNTASLSGLDASKALIGKKRKPMSNPSVEVENSALKSTARGDDTSCPKRGPHQYVSSQICKSDNFHSHLKPPVHIVDMAKSTSRRKRSKSRPGVADAEQSLKTITQSTISPLDVSSAGVNSKEKMLHDVTEGKDKPDPFTSAENEMIVSLDELSGQRNKACQSACTSPASCMACANVESPVCIGDGYFKNSCKRMSRSSLLREINGLRSSGEQPIPTPKDSRKRRDLTGVKVLFSRHLNESILKQQKKIVDRLKIFVASSILDATHFIADDFVRTRNMLEAIAWGKPVVTHLWLENVGRANYYIDEQEYILRDVKKEKEYGFNLSVSLAHACHRPLLLGRRVFITSNVKPGKDTVSSLVKAVQGQAVERVGRSLNDTTILDDLLILSSKEDYEVCIPFLEKGLAVYSSELLLNGIVTQKLEYERHRLFSDHVKKTRSTLWVKKDGRNFVPIKKHN